MQSVQTDERVCMLITECGTPSHPRVVDRKVYENTVQFAERNPEFHMVVAVIDGEDRQVTQDDAERVEYIRSTDMSGDLEDARWSDVDPKLWVCDRITKRSRFES